MAADYSWLHTYAPKSFKSAQLVIPEEERLQFLEISEGRSKENIILAGTAGTGKTSIATLLKKQAVNQVTIECPQMRSDKHWQTGGDGWQLMMGANPLDRFFMSKTELRRKKIPRLVLLEEFDLIANQSVFKTLLDSNSAREAVTILTTNNFSAIEEPIVSRCSVFHFGRESELWMNYEDDKPAGCRGQIEQDLRMLMRRVLYGEIKKSVRKEQIENPNTIQFFKNIINNSYPSVRECLTNARKYVRRGELIIPKRLLQPITDE